MSELTEKTRVPLSLLIVAASAVAVLAGGLAVAQYRIGNTDTRTDRAEEKVQALEIGQEVMKSEVSQTMKAVERIEARQIDDISRHHHEDK